MKVSLLKRQGFLKIPALATACVFILQPLTAPLAWAHDYTFPGGTVPGKPADPDGPLTSQPTPNNPSNENPKNPTDPVELFRGEFVVSRQDLFWPGRGLAVNLGFNYRSRSSFNGPFGYGWDMSYYRRVRKLINNNALVLRGANRRDEFVWNATTLTYVAPAGIYDTLVQNADGTHTLTSKHGIKEYFNVNGVLTKIVDRNGNTLTFSYDPAGALPITGKSPYFITQTTGVVAREYRLIRITDAIGRTVDFAYNAEGRLSSLTYAGRTVQYTYNTDGDLISVRTPTSTDFPSGSTTTYAYTSHNLTSITDPKGQAFLTNEYDSQDHVTRQTYGGSANVATLSYLPDMVCPSTPGSANAGYSLTLSPLSANPGDSLTATWTAPAGSSTSDWIGLYQKGAVNTSYKTYFYTNGATSGSNTLTTSASYAQGLYEARYLPNNGYTSVASSSTVCLGSTALVAQPSATEVVDRNGNRAKYNFDAAGHITKIEQFTDGVPAGEPASYVTQYEYNAAGEITRILYPRGNATEYTYDAKGNVLTIRSKVIGATKFVAVATDIVTAFTYNAFAEPTTVTDPRAFRTTFTYDAKGNLTRVTAPITTTFTSFLYNTFGQVTQMTEPGTLITTYTYDAATGNLLKIARDPAATNATTQFTYDAVGNVTSVTDTNASVTSFTYNELNQLKKVVAPAPFNFETNLRYDANGNLVQVDRQATAGAPGSLPGLGTVNSGDGWQSVVYAYNMLDRVTSIRNDLNQVTSYAYDGTGNLTQATDAKNQITRYTYDERDLVTQVTDPKNGLVQYGLDANGNAIRVTDPASHATDFVYDAFDRLTAITYADAAKDQFTYDKSSNVLSHITPIPVTTTTFVTRTYAYDAMDRLISKTVPGRVTTYTYDVASRLTRAADTVATLVFAYDKFHRLTSAATTYPTTTALTQTYAYDKLNRRTSYTYPAVSPAVGRQITYQYDALSRLTGQTDLTGQSIALGYDALSRRSSLSMANGVLTNYAYDAVSRLLSINSSRSGSSITSASYTYDAIGNRLSQTIGPVGGAKSFAYDALSQLTSATNPSVSFAYDGVGNRTTAAGVTYTANTLNQYTQVGSSAYTYDKAGNLLTDGTSTYTYDAENRVTKIVSGANTLLYTYDGLGRRISRSLNGVITRFYYDGLERIADRNAAGVVEASYLFGPGIDEAWELQRGSDTRTYSRDGLGSPLVLTDSTGAILERYSYAEFGAPTVTNVSTSQTGTASFFNNPILFTGREWEPEAQIYYYRARFYHPGVGRFTSRDPLGYAPDVNLYRYVGNSPVNWIDPLGWMSRAIGPGPSRPVGDMPFNPQPGGIITTPVSGPEKGPGGFTPAGPDGGPTGYTPGTDIFPRPQPGDKGPSKSEGRIQGTDQPGMDKAEPGTQGQQDKEEGGKKKGKKKEKYPLPDGGSIEIETRGQKGTDGGTSEVIKIKDSQGKTTDVWHAVTDSNGNIIHLHPK